MYLRYKCKTLNLNSELVAERRVVSANSVANVILTFVLTVYWLGLVCITIMRFKKMNFGWLNRAPPGCLTE